MICLSVHDVVVSKPACEHHTAKVAPVTSARRQTSCRIRHYPQTASKRTDAGAAKADGKNLDPQATGFCRFPCIHGPCGFFYPWKGEPALGMQGDSSERVFPGLSEGGFKSRTQRSEVPRCSNWRKWRVLWRPSLVTGSKLHGKS